MWNTALLDATPIPSDIAMLAGLMHHKRTLYLPEFIVITIIIRFIIVTVVCFWMSSSINKQCLSSIHSAKTASGLSSVGSQHDATRIC